MGLSVLRVSCSVSPLTTQHAPRTAHRAPRNQQLFCAYAPWLPCAGGLGSSRLFPESSVMIFSTICSLRIVEHFVPFGAFRKRCGGHCGQSGQSDRVFWPLLRDADPGHHRRHRLPDRSERRRGRRHVVALSRCAIHCGHPLPDACSFSRACTSSCILCVVVGGGNCAPQRLL